MKVELVQGNIVDIPADVVVNAANKWLTRGGGVCGAIFNAAGAEELEAACIQLPLCPTGEVRVTPAFRMTSARHIIHAVGPVWRGGDDRELELLQCCYRNIVQAVNALGAKRVTVPVISSGIYGYPPNQAAFVAVRELLDADSEATAVLVAYDEWMYEILMNTLKEEACRRTV